MEGKNLDAAYESQQTIYIKEAADMRAHVLLLGSHASGEHVRPCANSS